MIPIKHAVAISCVGIFLSACASKPPTFADRLASEGNARLEVSEAWEAGRDAAEEGEKEVRKGRKMIEKGREELRDGEALIAKGQIEVQNNRQAYQALYETPLITETPDALGERANDLEKLAKAWKKGEQAISKGHELIMTGNERIREGEQRIAGGQAAIVSGREKMQAAEKAYAE